MIAVDVRESNVVSYQEPTFRFLSCSVYSGRKESAHYDGRDNAITGSRGVS